jgi:serine/threonine protein kinase
LKVSDFGLSTLAQKGVGLLHTTCGTPNYVAPEVLSNNGYDGSAADVWSCGVILYVLMAGYLPFEEDDLPTLYDKITAGQFSCPYWFSPGATSLIHRILDPNPKTVSTHTRLFHCIFKKQIILYSKVYLKLPKYSCHQFNTSVSVCMAAEIM